MPLRRPIRVLLWSVVAFVVVVLIATVSLLTVPPPLERRLQSKVIDALQQHYQRDVHLQNLKITLLPEFEATADNFVLPNQDPSLPPFISARQLTVKAGLLQLLRKPVHLGSLQLEGLVIHVPPKGSRPPNSSNQAVPPARRLTRLANFEIGRVGADGTQLYVLRKDPTAEPMRFDIRKLALRSAGIGQPMKFTAELTNPKPPGLVESTGSFGPWNIDEPSDTKLKGHYVFRKADLSVFNGVSGTLSSVGDYKGRLNNIVVDGTTDTPDFQLDRGVTPVHLTTTFHAIVDGTNGNTYLQPVNAHFLNSNVIANGQVTGKPGQKGKTIDLKVEVNDSYLQDLLQLATKKENPAITGKIEFEGHVLVPPGKEEVLKKLVLNGNFHITQAQFTSDKVRKAIAELSRRGQGKPGDQSIQNVPAQFAGTFRLQGTVLSFSQLQFSVPGAAAQMKGYYGLRSEKLNFTGDVKLNARISEMVGGKKSWILVPFDLIFAKHNAGTYLPVDIGGTRDHPEIKVNWKKLFSFAEPRGADADGDSPTAALSF